MYLLIFIFYSRFFNVELEEMRFFFCINFLFLEISIR